MDLKMIPGNKTLPETFRLSANPKVTIFSSLILCSLVMLQQLRDHNSSHVLSGNITCYKRSCKSDCSFHIYLSKDARRENKILIELN